MKSNSNVTRLTTRGFAPVLIILLVVLLGGGTYAVVQRNVLKSFFEKGDKPTAGQFGDVIDSGLNVQDDRKLSGLKKYDTTQQYEVGDTAVQSQPISQSQTKAIADLPQGSAWLSTVPLGDGKYVTKGPKKGYVYICHVATGGGGAQVSGPWIHGATWSPSEKIRVQGAVSWPQATYKMSVTGATRTISSNDLPIDHTTGIFPIASSDPAAQYDRNPSSISAHSYSFALPAYPTALSTPDCIYGQVGIMNNGVLLFDGFDALYRDALAHELQDAHDGHPNNQGYHKHGFISDIKNIAVSQVVGFAFDGFPITGPKLPGGKYLTTSDLDECHGLTSTVELDGKQVSTYHYVLTQDFPYSVSCFKGKSHEPKPGGGTQGSAGTMQQSSASQSGPPNGGPPQEAIQACAGKSSNASCSFSTPQGTLSGICRTPPNSSLACVPN